MNVITCGRCDQAWCVQGREGLEVPVEPCRWYLNWFIWCPFTTTVAGAYRVQLQYRNVSFPLAASPFYPNLDSGTVVHVNPGPPSHLHFSSSGLSAEMFPGAPASGTLQARDKHGNRAPLNRVVATQGEQYWEESTFLQPSRGVVGASQTLDVLRMTATLQGCVSGCDYSGDVAVSLDGTAPGLVDVEYHFTKPGTYTIMVSYRGASSLLCYHVWAMLAVLITGQLRNKCFRLLESRQRPAAAASQLKHAFLHRRVSSSRPVLWTPHPRPSYFNASRRAAVMHGCGHGCPLPTRAQVGVAGRSTVGWKGTSLHHCLQPSLNGMCHVGLA